MDPIGKREPPEGERVPGPASTPGTVVQAAGVAFLGLNRWLQLFLTIIAGTVVAVIAWSVIERFMHIILLLLGSFLLAYLLGPLVDRLERVGFGRLLAILVIYLILLGGLAVGVILLVVPLSTQIQGLAGALPGWTDPKTGIPSQVGNFLKGIGIPVDVTTLINKATDYISGQTTTLLGSTLSLVAGLVAFVTDLLLSLAMAFYLLLDGAAMRNRFLRLLPAQVREKWFFIEATLNKVVGGYIRGQILVALTVGVAAGAGSILLGVQYPLVIGVLAFIFEFIPMLGPVLGMIPAVIIAFFQSPTLALWTIVYFIALQQVESNVIVPRISGHAVGLHPLAALLALLAGFELGGVAGALLAVPIVGVLYVLALALYADMTGNTELLISKPPPTAYSTLRSVVVGRRGPGRRLVGRRVSVGGQVSTSGQAALIEQSSGAVSEVATGDAVAARATMPDAIPNERLATIAQEQAELKAEFEAGEAKLEAEEAKQAAQEREADEGDSSVVGT